MRKNSLLLIAVIAAAGLFACKPSPSNPPKPNTEASGNASAASATASSPSDALTAQLRKVSGETAKDCGAVPGNGDNKPASDCALQSHEAKQPFFVRYELPVSEAKMSIATAQSADGKLWTIQYDSTGFKAAPENGSLSEDKKVATQPCPEPFTLRVANSGRVTCFPPQSMGAMGGSSPHGSMGPNGGAMGGIGTNPHGGVKAAPEKQPLTKTH